MLVTCSQCTLIDQVSILTCEKHCKSLPWTCHQDAPDLAWFGLLIIYTVSQRDAIVTDPCQYPLVVFCKYWHSGCLVPFLVEVSSILTLQVVWRNVHSVFHDTDIAALPAALSVSLPYLLVCGLLLAQCQPSKRGMRASGSHRLHGKYCSRRGGGLMLWLISI